MSDWNNAWTLGQATGGQPVNAVGVPGAAPAAGGTPASSGASTTTTPAGGTGQPAAKGPDMIFWLLPGMLLVMVLVSVMGGRKDKKRRAELLSAIKKGDKVQTMGGIIGTIAEMGDQDVVLRLEDGRMRVTKAAIQGVVGSASGTASSVEAKPESAKAAV